MEPIAKELGWTYAQISLASSIQSLGSSFFVPFVGVLFDRWGARRLVFLGGTATGLGLLLLSRSSSLLMLYGAFFLIALGISTGGGLMLTTVIGHWFRKKLSIAIGIAICGGALGGLLVPIVTRIIDIFGWRVAMVIFGLGTWAIILPLSRVLRFRPEPYGYLPDGDVSGKSVSNESVAPLPTANADVGVRQALKSRAFWYISIGLLCHSLASSAVITHVMPYLSSLNIPRSTSSLVASSIALAGIIGRLSFGWFGDRFDRRWVTAVGFFIIGLGLLLFGFISNVGSSLLVPFVILFGIGFGGPIPMVPALLLEYFGGVKLGTILGLSLGIITIGNSLGPPLAGWVFDSFGSYRGAWFSFIGVVIVGIIILVNTPSVNNKTRSNN